MRRTEERRRHSRRICRLSVRLKDPRELKENLIKDLGEGGVFVETFYPSRVGSKVDLEFHMEGGKNPLLVRGEVVWVRNPWESGTPGMGIRFLEISEEARRWIRDLVETL